MSFDKYKMTTFIILHSFLSDCLIYWMLVCVCLMSFIHTEEWTWIVIYPTLLIYWMLVCVFYDSHFHTWIRLYFYVIYLFQCNEWLFCDGIICSCDSNFDFKFRFKNQIIKIEYVLIFFVVYQRWGEFCDYFKLFMVLI